MARTLVLVRHGKAERRSEGLEDSQRRLTPGGARALAAQFPKSFALLQEGPGTPCVWTSPAVRARQTAEEAAHVLETPELRTRSSLGDQDAGAFLHEVAESDAPCIVAVGHNPFIEDLVERLSGVRLAFSTGAVAALELPDGFDPSTAKNRKPPCRLLWFMQGPHAKRWDTLCVLEGVLAEHADNVAFHLEAFLRDPGDVEALHRLRISIRTLRSLAEFCAPFVKKHQAKEVQHDLRAVVLQTSRLRELDVLAQQVAALDAPAADLLAACSLLRGGEQARVAAALDCPKVAGAVERARANLHGVCWKNQVARNGLSPDRLRRRFAEMADSLEKNLDRVDLADAEATHDLRKDAKRVRYTAEHLADLLGPVAVEAARRSHAVQDRLGALCDARVNFAIVAGFPTDGLSDAALRNLEEIRTASKAHVGAEAGA